MGLTPPPTTHVSVLRLEQLWLLVCHVWCGGAWDTGAQGSLCLQCVMLSSCLQACFADAAAWLSALCICFLVLPAVCAVYVQTSTSWPAQR